MERLVFAVALFLVSSFTSELFAQSSSSLHSEAAEATTKLLDMSSTDWSFYIDEEQDIYFIDFEKINVNLSDLQVKNDVGVVVLEDSLYELPVNTIYELDLSDYPRGTYDVELRTFTGVISKKITVE